MTLKDARAADRVRCPAAGLPCAAQPRAREIRPGFGASAFRVRASIQRPTACRLPSTFSLFLHWVIPSRPGPSLLC